MPGPDASNLPPPAPASEAEPAVRPSPLATPYNLSPANAAPPHAGSSGATSVPGPAAQAPPNVNPTGAAALPSLSYACQNTTMAQLAVAMHQIANGYVDHPAVDMTGLKGGYDFTITWTPRGAISSGGVRAGQPGQPDTVSDPSGGVTFFDAVDKLGLHLDSGQKHPMPVLVIDHIQPLGVDN